ncbi:MAG: hypothetical protein ACR2HQ_03810 [Ilumatobacteraceae bacterium]
MSETPTEPVASGPDIWSVYSPSPDAPGRSSPHDEADTSRLAAPLPPPAGPPAPGGVGAAADDPSLDVSTTQRAAEKPAGGARRRSTRPELLGVLVVVALLVAVLGLVLAARNSDDGDSGIVSNTLQPDVATTVPATSPPPSPTNPVVDETAEASATAAPGSAANIPVAGSTTAEPPATEPPPAPASTVAENTAPATAAPTDPPQTAPPQTAPPQTAPPQTAPPQTAPPQTAPPQTAPPQTAPPQTAPPETTSQPVAAGANVLTDPLPSGVRSAEVDSSLQIAQSVSDALAAGDWATVRRLSPGLGSTTDAEFVDGYGGLDRATQLLVDAERSPGVDRLLLVTIANERAGAQTTLYCVEAIVSDGGGLRQTTASVLQRFPGTIGLQDVTQDAEIADSIRRQCFLQ